MELLSANTISQYKTPFVVWLNDDSIYRFISKHKLKLLSPNYSIVYFEKTDEAIEFTLQNANDIFLFIQDSNRAMSDVISKWSVNYKNKISLKGVAGDFYYFIIDAFAPEAGAIFNGAGYSQGEVQLISEWGSLDSRIEYYDPYNITNDIIERHLNRWLNDNNSSLISKDVLVTKDIVDELIVLCNVNPSSIDKISPRNFEKLIASILKNNGFHVELTSCTRDGGYDIIAAENTSVNSGPILIEVKHFAPNRPVGVGIVRALYGTMHINSASKAILATSSYVSRDAKKEFSRVVPWELEFIERDKIIDLCKSCMPSILDKRFLNE